MESNKNYKIEDIQGIIKALQDHSSVPSKIEDIMYGMRNLADYLEWSRSNDVPDLKVLNHIRSVLDDFQEVVREALVISGANDAVQRVTDMLAIMNRKETPNLRMES